MESSPEEDTCSDVNIDRTKAIDPNFVSLSGSPYYADYTSWTDAFWGSSSYFRPEDGAIETYLDVAIAEELAENIYVSYVTFSVEGAGQVTVTVLDDSGETIDTQVVIIIMVIKGGSSNI